MHFLRYRTLAAVPVNLPRIPKLHNKPVQISYILKLENFAIMQLGSNFDYHYPFLCSKYVNLLQISRFRT